MLSFKCALLFLLFLLFVVLLLFLENALLSLLFHYKISFTRLKIQKYFLARFARSDLINLQLYFFRQQTVETPQFLIFNQKYLCLASLIVTANILIKFLIQCFYVFLTTYCNDFVDMDLDLEQPYYRHFFR